MATTSRARRKGRTKKAGRGKAKENSDIYIGAAWENAADGDKDEYISILVNDDFDGEIVGGDRLYLFVNGFKEQAKHPDWKLVRYVD